MQATYNKIVYLIHFDEPYLHAKHYMGSTYNLHSRLTGHAIGEGARLMEVIREAGITWQLTRVWQGDEKLERLLKNRKEAPALCPTCSGEAAYKRARYPDLNKVTDAVQILRIGHPSEVERVEEYYERTDVNTPWLYRGDDENRVGGEWFGRLAKEFDLKGEIDQERLYRLVEGRDPQSGEQLIEDIEPREYIRRVGLDAVFSAPASVAVLAYLSGDEDLKRGIWRDHIESVRMALEGMEEKHAYARVGEERREQSGNLIASIHHHEQAGLGDPVLLQVNTHAVIMNMTQGGDGHIHALSEKELLDSQAEARSIYYASLTEKLQRRGIEVALNPETNAPEVRRITQKYIEAVSPILSYGEADRIRRPIHVLVARKEMGVEERRSSGAYSAGRDILLFRESSATYGIERGEYGKVIELDSETNTLKLRLAGGRDVTVDPRQLYGVEVLEEVKRYFVAGDRIEFGSPFGQEAVRGEVATVERIEGKEFIMRLENGQEVRVDTEKFNHFDKLKKTFGQERSIEIAESKSLERQEGELADRSIQDAHSDSRGESLQEQDQGIDW